MSNISKNHNIDTTRWAKWVERTAEPDLRATLSRAGHISDFLAQCLAHRGVMPDAVMEFLHPSLQQLGDPFRFKGMQEAADAIAEAVCAGVRIGIYGDYDVDGVCSTAQFLSFLRAAGADVVSYIPNRLKEGYGLNQAAVDVLSGQHIGLLITVDCGITAHAEIDYARQNGMNVIVIDHHTVPETLVSAQAVVNPHQPGCESAGLHLCAAALSFYVTAAVKQSLRRRSRDVDFDLRENLDLVALATVADVMPLHAENRVFVTFGLKNIRLGTRLGITEILHTAQVDPETATSGKIGFQIGPRINAAGRLGSADIALKALLTHERRVAQQAAIELDRTNSSRRDIERTTVEAAKAQIEEVYGLRDKAATPKPDVLIVNDPEWHPGVVGIVASRLVDWFGLPAIVIGRNGRGSGRSVPDFNLHEALVRMASRLEGFGGHAHAAGLQIAEENISVFREEMHQEALRQMHADSLGRVYRYDVGLTQDALFESHWRDIDAMMPTGFGLANPILRLNQLRVRNRRELNGGHVKGQVEIGDGWVDILHFQADTSAADISEDVDVLVTLSRNSWQGRLTRQLIVQDIRPRNESK